MKKAMWAISLFSFIITAAAVQFMPDSVPMHYDIAGKIDRWGSKYENFIFPVLILLMSLFWHLFILHFEKRAESASADKEHAEALSNVKVMKITGVSMAAMFTVMQSLILYGSYVEANTGAAYASIDIGKAACILSGVILIVLGNFMPKTKKNRVVGVRVSWSLHNDTTWMKSNRFGGAAMITAGLMTIITTIFTPSGIAVVMLLVYILTASAATLVYTHKIYKKELEK